MLNELHAWNFVPEFAKALEEQLKSDEKRWGATWLKRQREGQEERTIKKFNDYFDQYEQVGAPLPWLKIAGNALICWLREERPELWEEADEENE